MSESLLIIAAMVLIFAMVVFAGLYTICKLILSLVAQLEHIGILTHQLHATQKVIAAAVFDVEKRV